MMMTEEGVPGNPNSGDPVPTRRDNKRVATTLLSSSLTQTKKRRITEEDEEEPDNENAWTEDQIFALDRFLSQVSVTQIKSLLPRVCLKLKEEESQKTMVQSLPVKLSPQSFNSFTFTSLTTPNEVIDWIRQHVNTCEMAGQEPRIYLSWMIDRIEPRTNLSAKIRMEARQKMTSTATIDEFQECLLEQLRHNVTEGTYLTKLESMKLPASATVEQVSNFVIQVGKWAEASRSVKTQEEWMRYLESRIPARLMSELRSKMPPGQLLGWDQIGALLSTVASQMPSHPSYHSVLPQPRRNNAQFVVHGRGRGRGRGRGGRFHSSRGRMGSHRQQQDRVQPNDQPGKPARETRTCHYCGKVGHLRNECRKRLREVAEGTLPAKNE